MPIYTNHRLSVITFLDRLRLCLCIHLEKFSTLRARCQQLFTTHVKSFLVSTLFNYSLYSMIIRCFLEGTSPLHWMSNLFPLSDFPTFRSLSAIVRYLSLLFLYLPYPFFHFFIRIAPPVFDIQFSMS